MVRRWWSVAPATDSAGPAEPDTSAGEDRGERAECRGCGNHDTRMSSLSQPLHMTGLRAVTTTTYDWARAERGRRCGGSFHYSGHSHIARLWLQASNILVPIMEGHPVIR